MRFGLLPTAFAITVLTAVAAAQTKSFTVELTGEQQAPPLRTSGIGTAIVQLDTSTGAVSVAGRYRNLIGNAIAAHIHGNARRGANAGVRIGLTVSGGTGGTFSGSGMLNAAQVRDLLDGLMYVNVHSIAHPGGEIRAQIDVVPGSGTNNTNASPSISGAATPGGTLLVGCPPSIDRPR